MLNIKPTYHKLALASALALILTLITHQTAIAANRDVCPTCNYTTIGDAMNVAQDGDTIRIATGTYEEGIYFSGSKSVRIEGGYNPDFSIRDTLSYPSTVRGASISYYYVGDAEIDGLTVSGSASQGIYAWSFDSTLSVSNCIIHDNYSSGIFISGIKSFSITGSTFWGNGDYGAIDISDSTHLFGVISGNVASGNTVNSAAGISMTNAKSTDVISRNEVFGNYYGLNIRAASSSDSPVVEWNFAHENLAEGINLQGGAPNVSHNLSWKNGGKGLLMSYPYGGSFLSNIFANNNGEGLLIAGSAHGVHQPIRNNIFYKNYHGASFSGNTSGWGSTDLQPVLEYNVFYQNVSGEIIHSGEAPWSFEAEQPGSYGELNGPSWSNYNIYFDPGFADPENGDFSLRPDSFLIDEGSPDDAYNLEPAQNGGRINIGLYGNTGSAVASPSAPVISNLSVAQDGSDISIGFDVSVNTSDYWLKVEYLRNSVYEEVTPASLSSTALTLGYARNRIAAGTGISLIWLNAENTIPSGDTTLSLRVTLLHGDDSVSSTTSCGLSFVSINTPSPTPTTVAPTATPIATITATPSATLTPVPAETPSEPPAVEPTIVPSPQPTSAGPASRQIRLYSAKNGEIKIAPQALPSCGEGCYIIGSSVSQISLKARANSGFRFKRWISHGVALPSGCRTQITCRFSVKKLRKSQSAVIGAEYSKVAKKKKR